MQNTGSLQVRVIGKNMELSVYDNRVELFKEFSGKIFAAPYIAINKILFRQPSDSCTGFIKIRANGVIIDFVTYRFGFKDSPQHIAALQDEMSSALSEIASRVAEARDLSNGANLVTYF